MKKFITLHHVNGIPITINIDSISGIEQSAYTRITYINGKTELVSEPADVVMRMIEEVKG